MCFLTLKSVSQRPNIGLLILRSIKLCSLLLHPTTYQSHMIILFSMRIVRALLGTAEPNSLLSSCPYSLTHSLAFGLSLFPVFLGGLEVGTLEIKTHSLLSWTLDVEQGLPCSRCREEQQDQKKEEEEEKWTLSFYFYPTWGIFPGSRSRE